MSRASPTSQFNLQPFFRFSYVTSSSVNSPGKPAELSLQPFHDFTYVTTLQPFRRFTYITAHSPTLPLLHLYNSSFSNPSFAFPTSQALHLRHLASCPCLNYCSECGTSPVSSPCSNTLPLQITILAY